MQLALDKSTNDLFKPEGGGVHRVKDGRFVVQQVQSKLRTLLGEWILDSRVGYINLSDLRKGYDLFDLEDRLTRVVTETQGVLELTSINLVVTDRKLNVSFTALTIFGIINSTVPWEDEVKEVFVELPDIQELIYHNGEVVTFNGVAITHTIINNNQPNN